MKVTQQDIADSLSISRLTVSKALNNMGGVSADTRNQILKVAKELGYQHISEKQLITARCLNENDEKNLLFPSKQIYLFSNLKYTDSYWAPVISGMARVFSNCGYNLNLCLLNLSDESEFEFPVNFDFKAACGIIQFGNFKKSHCKQIQKCTLPIISIDTIEEAEKEGLFSDTIMSMNIEPMAALVDHLVRQGHTKIGYAGLQKGQLTNKERWTGYCLGMERAGLQINPGFCFSGETEDICEQLEKEKRLTNLKDFPTAIICFNDMLAISIMKYLRANRVSVPDVVAIAGFDNLSESQVADLTSVHVNKEEIGMCAAEMMLWRMEHPGRPYRLVRIFDNKLLIRNSTSRSLRV